MGYVGRSIGHLIISLGRPSLSDSTSNTPHCRFPIRINLSHGSPLIPSSPLPIPCWQFSLAHSYSPNPLTTIEPLVVSRQWPVFLSKFRIPCCPFIFWKGYPARPLTSRPGNPLRSLMIQLIHHRRRQTY